MRWNDDNSNGNNSNDVLFTHNSAMPSSELALLMGIDVGIHFLIYKPSERRMWEQGVISNCQTKLQI